MADVAAVGDPLEVAADDRLAVVEHPLRRLGEDVEPIPLHDAQKRGGTRAHADDLGVDVAGNHLRHTRVRSGHAEDVRDQLAARYELHAGEDRPLLEDVDRVRRVRILRPDVQPVAFDGRVPDQLVAEVHRHHQRGVLRVRARAVRDVVEHDVAGLECFLSADRLDGCLDAEAHRAHEGGQARRLRE